MTDIIGTLRSRAPRYDIKNDTGLTVTIEKEDTSRESVEVKLLNISVNGAKMKTSETVTIKEMFTVTIEVEDPQRVIAVSGDVCWVTPAAGDDWSLGCKFKPPIPEEVLHDFAEAGILERREHGRKRVSLRTSAQWELRSGTTSVRIANYSRGGFCLCSQVEGKPGERTLLQLETDHNRTIVIPGKIKWQVKSQDGFAIGCEFLDSADYGVLCELLDPIPQVDSDGNKPKPSVQLARSNGLIATCVVALLGIAIALGLWYSTGIQTSAATQIVDSMVASEAEASREQKPEHLDGDATIDQTQEAAPADSDPLPPVLVAERLKQSETSFNMGQTPGGTDVVVEEHEAFNESLSLPTQNVTSTTTTVDSLESVDDRRSKKVVTEVQPQKQNQTKTIVSKAAPGTGDLETTASDRVGYRTWIDNTGRYRVVARIVTVKDGIVRLQKEHGGITSVPLNRLSEDDARFVSHWISDSQ